MSNYHKKQAIVIIKNKDILCLFYIIPAHIDPSRSNAKAMSHSTKNPNESKTEGIGLSMGLKHDDLENLAELNNRNKIVSKNLKIKFELN